ncbi:MAG: hypothetical protein JXA52_05590, partial [Planctomycetes bacterium]|nr:hypothetical protein [Planctomycetota bacterium]
GGGVLGLLGPGAEETMQGLRLPRQTSRETDSSIIKSQPCGLGKLFFWDEFSDLETIKENQLKLAIASHNSDINKILASLSGEDSYRYGQSRYNRRVAENIPKEISSLLEGLMKIPILGYSIIAILLAIIVGPLNLIILRRRKKIILFYLTAPALAIIGMLMLGSYTVVSEGLGAKLNEIAVLVHDPAFDDGAIYHAKGIYSAFAPSRLGYPAQTAAIPFWQGDQGIDILANDWNQGNTLTSGFVRSRSPSGLFTITPQHVRMGITVERGEDGKIYAHNGLTSTASWVIALVDKPSLGLTYYFTRNQIPPGEKAILQENNTVLNETFAAIPLLNKQLLRFQVCAELEALPYMEHGGLEDARVLSGKYYYVVLHSKADE